MSGSLPQQTLKFSGNQSTLFLNSLLDDPPSDWSAVNHLDISAVSFITPVVCVLTGVAISCGWNVSYPIRRDANDYLSYMLTADQYRSCDRYIPLSQCVGKSFVFGFFINVRSVIEGWVSERTTKDICYFLAESMDNVFDHSHSEKGFWLHTQKYPENSRLEIVIVDLGRGISESLKDNQDFFILPDIDRFSHALELGVSANPKQHSGEGLSSTLEWVKMNRNAGARAIIISHQFAWFSGKSSAGIVDLEKICWPGTLLWLNIPFLPDKSMNDVWESFGLVPE